MFHVKQSGNISTQFGQTGTFAIAREPQISADYVPAGEGENVSPELGGEAGKWSSYQAASLTGACMYWKSVPDFPDYEVSESGEMRRGLKYLKARKVSADGRPGFALSKRGVVTVKSAAKWVALAFMGPSPFAGAVVCHNNGCVTDNRVSNLRWDSALGNSADRLIHSGDVRRDGRVALTVEASRILASSPRPKSLGRKRRS